MHPLLHLTSAVFLVLVAVSAAASQSMNVSVRITDEHGSSLPEAQVTLSAGGFQQSRSTDASGRATWFGLRAGVYRLAVSKRGFYPQSRELDLTAARNEVQVELTALREFEEDIEVTARASPVDPQQTASSESLSGRDVLTIPYPTTRDYRNVLPYLPGVVSNVPGDLHIAGASTQESASFLDGFEVSQPAAGSLQLRISPDATRLLEVENSRYPVRFGKSAGGILNIETQDADNHFRWNIVNFIPTFQTVKGLRFNSWTPRAYVAGPIIKNRLWYYIAHLQENTLDIVEELPKGQDSSRLWRADDLLKLHWMPDTRHSISASAIVNVADNDHYGISQFDPVSTSTNQYFTNVFVGLRDQIKLGQGNLLDVGIAYQRFHRSVLPLGTGPYIFAPEGRTGSFFEASRARSRRAQQHLNLFVRPLFAYGTHHLSAGVGTAQLAYAQDVRRSEILFTNAEGELERRVVFGEAPRFRQTLNELSAYMQDRWLIGSRATIEAGVRWDHDDLLRSSRISPRFAASYLLHPARELKVTAGWGLYTARSNLDLLTRPQQGSRTDLYYQPASAVPDKALSMTFVSSGASRLPQATNWSVGAQARLFSRFYGGIEFLSRKMDDALGYSPIQEGVFALANSRTEHYRAIQFRLEGEIAEGRRIAFAYTRSRGVTNQVLDYSIDNPVFGAQAAGRLPWDAPNQLVAWGSLPFFKWQSIDFAYSLLWRSGFPFITVNSRDQLVDSNRRRLPDFFSFNPALEKKFSLKTYRLALRVGIDNITNSQNATAINNNVDSPTFLQVYGKRHRTLNARIRLLGRK